MQVQRVFFSKSNLAELPNEMRQQVPVAVAAAATRSPVESFR